MVVPTATKLLNERLVDNMGKSSVSTTVDHIIYGVPDLAGAVEQVYRSTSVRPAAGGRHKQYGTHNALLSLGPSTYLEIMAHDKNLPIPKRGVLFGLDKLTTPRIVTWVIRSDNFQNYVSRMTSAGCPLGPVGEGTRENRDGSILNWTLTDPYEMPLDGVLPFLIDWHDTPHPATTTPAGVRLKQLVLTHPEAKRLQNIRDLLPNLVSIVEGLSPLIAAILDTPAGTIRL